jgi:NADH-quinone oxidoreductase subunit G
VGVVTGPTGGTGELVTVVIDGAAHRVEAGRNMLDIALSLGYDLPFFCWHPVMGSIGACRQCAVRLWWTARDGSEKSDLAMACMTEAAEGTRISILDEEATVFRRRMIELMMLSHPHDCPVCDEGGECHLQDMTVMTGHAYRRYDGLKRTFRNQDLGPFVAHEMNRCITCYRCTRFYNDYAGGHDFGPFGSRNQVYFGRAASGTLESEFSGNLVEVCPTGVFTDKTLGRHYSRKWDLQTAPAVCQHCGLGCGILPGARYGELRRITSRYNLDVNKMWLCDRGRFGYAYVNAPERVRAARVAWRPPVLTAESGQEPVEKRRDRALDAAAALVRGRRVIGIGSPRAPLEANYALRTLVGPAAFYDGMSDADHELVGVVLEVARSGLRLGALGDVQGADVVLVLGEDLTNTAPLADLAVRTWHRLRPTAQEARTHIRSWNDAAVGRAKRHEPSRLWLATPHATKLDEIAAEAWRATPDDIARLALALAHELDPAAPEVPDLTAGERERVARWAGPLRDSRKAVVVSGTSGGSATLVRAAARLAAALPRAEAAGSAASAGDGPGDQAAEVLAAAPEPARLVLTVPEVDSVGLRMMQAGRLSHAIAAVARGEVDVVAMLGNDLYRRAAPLLVDDLVRRAPDLLVLAALEDTITGHADVVLPVPTFADSTGTYVNNEGRAQRSYAVLPSRDETQEAWRWLRDLMLRGDVKEVRGWTDEGDVLAALEHDLPQFRGVAAAAPPPGWRQDGREVARQTQRHSGRTALDADRTVWEPAPSPDADSPLAYSLEGLRPYESPAALLSRVWSPGWNSGSGLHKLQEEVMGPLRGGPSGVRLLDGAHGAAGSAAGGAGSPAGRPQDVPAPPPFAPHPGGELLLVPLHHIFGSDDLSMREPGIAARAPQPYVAANEAAAAALGLADGDPVTLSLPWMDLATTFRVLPSLPDGVAGVPVGLPRTPYIALPARGRILPRPPAPPQHTWGAL